MKKVGMVCGVVLEFNLITKHHVTAAKNGKFAKKHNKS